MELQISIVTIWNVNVLPSFERAETSRLWQSKQYFKMPLSRLGQLLIIFHNVPYSHAEKLPFDKLEFELLQRHDAHCFSLCGKIKALETRHMCKSLLVFIRFYWGSWVICN